MTNAIAKKENGNTYASFGNVVDNIFQNSLRRFFDDNFWDAEGQLSTASVPRTSGKLNNSMNWT